MHRPLYQKTRRLAGFLFALLVWTCSSDSDLTVGLPEFRPDPGSDREIAYTDKGDAFWVTRAGGYHNSPWHGLTASKRSYFEDLFIYANGDLLPREKAEVRVDPSRLVREYSDLGIREIWTLVDHERSLLLQLEADAATHWTVQPAIQGGGRTEDFTITESEHELKIQIHSFMDLDASYPYMRIWFSQPMQWLPAETPGKALYSAFLTPRADYNASHRLVVRVSLSAEDEALELQPTWLEAARSSRQQRLKDRLESSSFSSNIPDLDMAVSWAHASLDALVMDQMGKGIYAGLPWFDDYWGRDLFISYPGAILLAGDWELARQILQDFATYQDKDPQSPTYGRVPNRAQPTDIIYNTTDGTPWFVRSVWGFYRYSGDGDFLAGIWPAVKLATLGALENWTDEYGFLIHDDADTWMDAKGPAGPWSPRGDRAIDIQFLWRDQLNITMRLAERFEDQILYTRCAEALELLQNSLGEYFKPGTRVMVDHLNADGSQDTQERPNVLLIPPVLGPTVKWETFEYLAPRLITAQGVLSLAQDDPNFHPYHQQPSRYVKDAAYHNGIIWNWNAGPVMTHAIDFRQYELAETLFEDLTHELLQRGALGTLAEVKDAWPRGDNELVDLSGTFSQAWSLAEYLRVFYQDILGIHPNLTAETPIVDIHPRLLKDLKNASFSVPIGEDTWFVEYEDLETAFEITLRRAHESAVRLSLSMDGGEQIDRLWFTWADREIVIRYEKFMHQWTLPGHIEDAVMNQLSPEIVMNSISPATLELDRDIPALKGPDHRLLHSDEVHGPGGAIFWLMEDEAGDDAGLSGGFSYPTNPQFAAGIADIRKMEILQNEQSYRFTLTFEDLVDPGWHPEYGYQLTYAAIGIDIPERKGDRDIGRNAHARWQGRFAADYTIHVSGAILVLDGSGPVAEFLPEASSDAIGHVETASVEFSLPKELFDRDLKNARFQVAVGLQDDHGGAGLGDFRDIRTDQAEWWGGGGSAAGSNVYDWLVE